MSFPRNTDVSLHLARKPRAAAAAPSNTAPDADPALHSLSEDLSAAVNGAQSASTQGGGDQ